MKTKTHMTMTMNDLVACNIELQLQIVTNKNIISVTVKITYKNYCCGDRLFLDQFYFV